MNAANPEQATTAARGWVLYDGDCSLCRGAARRCEGWLRRHGFELAALQTDWVCRRFGFDPQARPAEMLVLMPDGRAWGGADGLVQLARRVWWAWPIFALAQLPGVMNGLRMIYRYVAERRSCKGKVCEVPRKRHLMDWALLGLLPALAFAIRDFVPAWFFMWALAGAVYFGWKWLTWRRAVRQASEVKWWRSVGYLLGWVGMDASRFLDEHRAPVKVTARETIWAFVKMIIGVALVWMVARCLVVPQPMLAGWVGMLGVSLCLHFGLFDLLALAWRRAGVDAPYLMREPWRAVSLADFWGRRWNGAFHLLATDFVFRPLMRKCGTAGAMMVVFLVSGLIHDLIISVPARGGYGLPTAYFLIQGLGLLFERSEVAARVGLRRGWRGWIFTIACTAGPAYWLFHPLFVRNVILPMLHAIGAT